MVCIEQILAYVSPAALVSVFLAFFLGGYRERRKHRTNWGRIFESMKIQMEKNDARLDDILEKGAVSRFPQLYGALELALRADPIEDL